MDRERVVEMITEVVRHLASHRNSPSVEILNSHAGSQVYCLLCKDKILEIGESYGKQNETE